MYETIKDGSLEAVSWLLAFFYSLPVVGGSYGIAIMLLTLAVMVVLMPLTLKATRSTIKMTQLQPEMRALQKKYKDDKQQLNQELMGLYQKHGVNPVGGCLPMLAQLPVFLVLFNVLRGLTRRVDQLPYYAISDRAHDLIGTEIEGGQNFDPQYLEESSELYQDLAQDNEMLFGPFDLAVNAGEVVQDNFLGSFPYIVLILFVVGTSYYQQKQISARRGAQPDNPTPQQQTQQQLLRILPLMSGIWSFFFPAGLVLYWATSNLFRIGQQSYITRALYSGDGPGANPPESLVDDDDDDEPEDDPKSDSLIGDGKPGKAGSNGGSARNGSGGSGKAKKKSSAQGSDGNGSGGGSGADGGGREDRNEAWARRRAERTKTKERKKTSSPREGSSRTTPKGTQPTAAKKKRKR